MIGCTCGTKSSSEGARIAAYEEAFGAFTRKLYSKRPHAETALRERLHMRKGLEEPWVQVRSAFILNDRLLPLAGANEADSPVAARAAIGSGRSCPACSERARRVSRSGTKADVAVVSYSHILIGEVRVELQVLHRRGLWRRHLAAPRPGHVPGNL